MSDFEDVGHTHAVGRSDVDMSWVVAAVCDLADSHASAMGIDLGKSNAIHGDGVRTPQKDLGVPDPGSSVVGSSQSIDDMELEFGAKDGMGGQFSDEGAAPSFREVRRIGKRREHLLGEGETATDDSVGFQGG